MSEGTPGVRYAEIFRESEEARVQVVLDLDGGTRQDVLTGIGFFDHLLTHFARHGYINLGVSAEGDLEVDEHHTVEEVGLVLGQAISEALAGGEPVERVGHAVVPVDDALVLVAVEIGGGGGLYADLPFRRERIGELSTECVRQFFHRVALHSQMTVHVRKLAGENDHHVCEAAFNAFGRALHLATRTSERRSSKSGKGKRD
jgi:imidazoleglycerol-phosphate dehydratase